MSNVAYILTFDGRVNSVGFSHINDAIAYVESRGGKKQDGWRFITDNGYEWLIISVKIEGE